MPDSVNMATTLSTVSQRGNDGIIKNNSSLKRIAYTHNTVEMNIR